MGSSHCNIELVKRDQSGKMSQALSCSDDTFNHHPDGEGAKVIFGQSPLMHVQEEKTQLIVSSESTPRPLLLDP